MMGWTYTHMQWLQIGGIPQPQKYPLRHEGPAQGSSAGKTRPHYFWLWKSGIIAEWVRGLLESQVFLFQGLCTDTLRLTLSSLLGQWLKRCQEQTGRTELSGNRARAKGQISPRQRCCERLWFPPEPSSPRASRRALYLSLHKPV